MTLSSWQDLSDLEGSLDRISEAKFREIAKLLEETKDQPGVQAILNRMRERLRRVRPQRKPTLQRLFYRPFEDLLVHQVHGTDDGRITRESARLAWSYVMLHSDAAERRILATMEARLRATESDDTQAQLVMARRLWPSTAALLEDALVKAGTNKQTRFDLVGDAVEQLDSMRQLVRVLQVAEDVELLKDTLPARPIRGLMGSQLALIRQTVALGHDGKINRAYAILLSVLVRISQPAEFLKRIAHLNFDLPDTTKASLFARLGRTILADLEMRTQDIDGMPVGDLPNRVDRAQFLIDELSAASRVLRDSDPETRDRLAHLHKTAADTVSAVIEWAGGLVARAIPNGASAPVDDLVQAEAAVLALRKCAVFADEVRLDRAARDMLASIVIRLTDKVADVFDRLKRPDLSLGEKSDIEDQIYWSIRMLELIGRGQAAEEIRQEFLTRQAQA